MANFFKPALFTYLVAGLTTVAFTTAVIYPPQVHTANVILDPAAINFDLNVERIFQKIKKNIDKEETNKIVGYMFDYAELEVSWKYAASLKSPSNWGWMRQMTQVGPKFSSIDS